MLATLSGFIAADAQAALDTITLTRSGANTYTFSVSTTNTSNGNKYGGMRRKFVESASSCTGTDGYSDSILPAADDIATYSRTITGNADKYVCIRGYYYDGAHNFHYATAGPLTYAGLTLTLNSAGDDNKYETDDHIDVTAAFGYNVTVSGTPRIALTIGNTTRYATYSSGSGTGNLKFRYTVVAADEDSDGISIAANALSLNSGTLQDSGNTSAVITHSALAASRNHLVNPDYAPSFASNASIADVSVIQNRPMRSVRFPQASGGDGALSYSVTPTLPAGLSLEATTGLLSGTPTGTSAKADYTYTVSDSDTNTADSDKDTLSFKLEVLGENTLKIHHEIEDGFLRKDGGRTFALDYIFNGPSTTTYSATSTDSAVATATVSGSTLTVKGVKHGMVTITVTATSGSDSVSQSFELEIYGQNSSPVWSTLPDVSVETGKTVTIDLYDYASDPEGTALSFGASSAKAAVATAAVSQTSILTITAVAEGTAKIHVLAGDGGFDFSTLFTVTVSSSNAAPSFANNATITIPSLVQYQPLKAQVLPAASGGNGQLSYSLSPALPAGLVFDPEARTISGAPTVTATSASYTYTVADSDNTTGSGDEDTLTFTLAVAAEGSPTAPTVTKVSYHTWDDAHDPSATSATGPHPYGTALFVRFTFSKAMYFKPGDTDAARPAFVGVVDGKAGPRFRVVERINDEAHEIPDQCAPFNPTLTSHTVFQCMILEPAWHLHGPGNLPNSNVQYTIRVLSASTDLGGTAMASHHTPTAITIDPTGPTVSSTGYYSNAAATTAISGSVSADDDIYTKVVFSENMAHKAATDASARPHFSYAIGGSTTATQFDVVANTETLESGECKPSSAPPANTYVCMYTVASGDTGSFDFVVAATRTTTALGGGDVVPLTTDVSGNVLNATVFKTPGSKHSSSLSLTSGLKLYGLQLLSLKLASPLADEPPADQGVTALVGKTLTLSHVTADATGCLDVQGAGANNGQNVQTWACNNTQAQEWRLEQRTSGDHAGRYRLVSGVGDGATYCLDNRGDFSDSDRMSIWSCVSDTHGAAANQTFDLTASGNGWVLTFVRDSTSSMLWAERSATDTNGNVGQRTGTASARAVWQLTDPDATQPAQPQSDQSDPPVMAQSQTPAPAFVGQAVTLRHVAGGTTGCLDVTYAAASNGQAVQTWTCNQTKAQVWRVEQRTSGDHTGRYRLVSGVGDGSTYCLDNRGEFSDSASMDIWSCVSDTHGAAGNQSVDLTASGNGWILTFVKDTDSSVLWAERSGNSVSGNVGQRSSHTTGSSAVWQITEMQQPALSVADATVTEGAGEPLTFTISLDRAVLASDGTVSVDYATGGGTATAGADYTAASGTLTFATGESSKTVNVTVLDDAHDDGGETLNLVLSNVTGATIADGTGTGTIENSDAMPQAWAARFGRTVGMHITDAVSARLREESNADSYLTVAGWRMPLGSRGSRQKQADTTGQADDPASRQADASRQASATDQTGTLLTGLAGILGLNSPTGGAQGLAPGGNPNGPVRGTLNEAPWLNGSPRPGQNPGQALNLPDLRQALVGSAFRLNLNQSAGGSVPRLTAWGRVAHTQFDGQDGHLSLDGEVTTGTVGLDTQGDRWLAGIAIAHSQGDGGYTDHDQDGLGDLETTLTSLHPYLRYALTDRLTVWGLMGLWLGRPHPDPAWRNRH